MASPLRDLSPADSRHVEVARRFLSLGLHQDARDELEAVEPAGRAAPEVLALKVDLLLAQNKADKARTVAAGAVEIHPRAGCCHYALALAEARTANFPAVKESLASAFRTSSEWRAGALDDARLEDYWRILE